MCIDNWRARVICKLRAEKMGQIWRGYDAHLTLFFKILTHFQNVHTFSKYYEELICPCSGASFHLLRLSFFLSRLEEKGLKSISSFGSGWYWRDMPTAVAPGEGDDRLHLGETSCHRGQEQCRGLLSLSCKPRRCQWDIWMTNAQISSIDRQVDWWQKIAL